MDIFARIDRWGHDAPHRSAHISGARQLTYHELIHRSNALAAYLARALPGDGTPVAVVGHKEPEMLIAFLGAVKSGHPYIPLDTTLPAQRINQIISSSEAGLTLTPQRVMALSDDFAPAPRRHPDTADPYYIMFTSGSTGTPKGVVITYGCLINFLAWMLAEQELSAPGEVFLNQVPFSFDVSVMDLYFSLISGGTIFSITREDIANPRQLYEALGESGVTIWVSTPSFARLCLADRSFSQTMLPRLRRFIFCGETLAPEVASQLLDRFPDAPIWNTYGPTEATVATTSVRIDRAMIDQYTALPIGRPMPGTRMPLLDPAGRPVAPGTKGEIIISGPNVSPGYLGRPDLTARAFFELDGVWSYRTGDLGHERDGLLFFDGRRDNQIKLHGYRIELGDVEAHLQALPEVRDAVVVAKLKQDLPDSLAAFVILNERPAVADRQLARDLGERLAERLPRYMVPRIFRFLEAFPMTTNGKADRRKLAELLV
ncbi:MAG TPA: D-alanine--poly(phosphoribitol) ligase subunit DltA [Roseiflexaceae bacterium]|nr:D-alanine--poly(phosphoribitol) ligase subunit DltA [Roseiflexaceae bacterium]